MGGEALVELGIGAACLEYEEACCAFTGGEAGNVGVLEAADILAVDVDECPAFGFVGESFVAFHIVGLGFGNTAFKVGLGPAENGTFGFYLAFEVGDCRQCGYLGRNGDGFGGVVFGVFIGTVHNHGVEVDRLFCQSVHGHVEFHFGALAGCEGFNRLAFYELAVGIEFHVESGGCVEAFVHNFHAGGVCFACINLGGSRYGVSLEVVANHGSNLDGVECMPYILFGDCTQANLDNFAFEAGEGCGDCAPAFVIVAELVACAREKNRVVGGTYFAGFDGYDIGRAAVVAHDIVDCHCDTGVDHTGEGNLAGEDSAFAVEGLALHADEAVVGVVGSQIREAVIFQNLPCGAAVDAGDTQVVADASVCESFEVSFVGSAHGNHRRYVSFAFAGFSNGPYCELHQRLFAGLENGCGELGCGETCLNGCAALAVVDVNVVGNLGGIDGVAVFVGGNLAPADGNLAVGCCFHSVHGRRCGGNACAHEDCSGGGLAFAAGVICYCGVGYSAGLAYVVGEVQCCAGGGSVEGLDYGFAAEKFHFVDCRECVAGKGLGRSLHGDGR